MEIEIGRVTHYFTHLGVAVVALNGDIKIGDALLFLGHTTDFEQLVCSMEIEHRMVQTAQAGTSVAIQVSEPVRVNDRVYRIVDESENPRNLSLWEEMRQAQVALFSTYQHVFSRFQQQQGVSEQTISLLLAALTLEPGTTSPEKLMVRGPYTAASEWMARLHAAKDKMLMLEPEPGEFRLSPKGRTVTRKLIRDSRKAMEKADPLSLEEGRQLVALLTRLVQASLFKSPPPDTWSIRLSYQLMPAEEPPLPYIEQALSCLRAYREDAHLAAWQPCGLDAQALEALTLIWRDQVRSLDGLYDRLAQRGFERHDYQAALQDMRQRGLLAGDDQDIKLTAAGQELRNEIEQLTDHYFFAPWDCLAPGDTTLLACLLNRLRYELEKKAPK